VPFEECPVFILKGLLAMVFALIGDVFPHGFDVGFGNGEYAVSGLPCEGPKFRSLVLDPFGRGFFDVLHGLTDRHGAGEFEKEVDVIFDRIDEDGVAIEVLEDGGHVGMQRAADGIRDEGFAVFGAENQMHVEAGEGLRHGLGRPFRAWGFVGPLFPGRCPGLSLVAPLALERRRFIW
jgi:hypothetical protein